MKHNFQKKSGHSFDVKFYDLLIYEGFRAIRALQVVEILFLNKKHVFSGYIQILSPPKIWQWDASDYGQHWLRIRLLLGTLNTCTTRNLASQNIRILWNLKNRFCIVNVQNTFGMLDWRDFSSTAKRGLWLVCWKIPMSTIREGRVPQCIDDFFCGLRASEVTTENSFEIARFWGFFMLLSTFEGICLTQIDSEDQKFFSQKSERTTSDTVAAYVAVL